MREKPLQTCYSLIAVKGELGDLTAEWVDEQLAEHNGGWQFEPGIYIEFPESNTVVVTVYVTYTARGANRADVYKLAHEVFMTEKSWELEIYVPKKSFQIVQIAA